MEKQTRIKFYTMKNKIKIEAGKICILLFVMMVLLSSLVSGLGISPGEKKIAFKLDEVQKIKYTVINNEHKNMVVLIYADGDIANNVRFASEQLTLTSSEDSKDFEIEMSMPASMHPGDNTGRIIAEETIENLSFLGTMGQGRIRVISKLVVMVPYPEKYVDVNLDVRRDDAGKTEVVTKMTNLGLKDIQALNMELGVYEEDKKVQDLKSAVSGGLLRGEETTSISEIDRNTLPGGLYSVVASIKYDDYTLEVSRDFEIGENFVKVLSYTKYFLQDSVNKFEIDVQSDWNKKIKQAYATIDISRYNKEVAKLRSQSYDIEPREKKTVSAYWDTSGLELGKYDANMSILSSNRSVHQLGEVSIVDPETYKKMMSKPFYKSWIFIVIVAIVVVNAVFWFFIIRKLRKKR